MNTNPHSPSGAAPAEAWNRPRPAHLPQPSIWPAAFSLAVTLLAWGMVTSLVIIVIGMVLIIVSLAGWIGDICHEQKQHS